jgi:hypothetical protein
MRRLCGHVAGRAARSRRRSCRPRSWKPVARLTARPGRLWKGKLVRRGGALLPGLFRCARCSQKPQLWYGGIKTFSQRNTCRGAFSERAEMSCISFGGMRVDRAVAREVVERVQPLESKLRWPRWRIWLDKVKQLENAIEQARFEAARACRQYDSVDPENRPVATDLERRWNQKLEALHALEERHRSKRPIAHGCWPLEMTCHEHGALPASASRRARKSSGS